MAGAFRHRRQIDAMVDGAGSAAGAGGNPETGSWTDHNTSRADDGGYSCRMKSESCARFTINLSRSQEKLVESPWKWTWQIGSYIAVASLTDRS